MMVRKISRRGHQPLSNNTNTSHKISNAKKTALPPLLDYHQVLEFKPDLSAADLGFISQMEHRHKIRPVQLFVPSSSNPNTLRLNKSALNAVLGHSSIANRKIVVISVSGAYRKGKSFLLNFFLEYLYILQYQQKNDLEMDWLQDETQLEGFHYRPGSKRDTVGIWIWAEPIMIDGANGERIAVLLMDTQGCFEQSGTVSQPSSSTRDVASSNAVVLNNSHHSVLALSTMLSSIQLYNVAESIPDESIQALAFFTDYNKLHSMEASAFGKPFQKFVMLVRDFKVSEQLIYGIDGGTKLLDKALRQINNTSDVVGGSLAEKALKEIKKEIRNCFDSGFSCYLLPNPGPKVTDQASSFKGLAKEIKALFRDEVRRVVEAMIGPNLTKPKVVNGKEITVRKFVECVREYAKIFEAPELPAPRSVLNANLQLSCVDYALEAKIAYCRGMDRVTRSSRMMAEKKLLEAHIKHGIKALNIYDKCPKVDSGDVRSTNLARLQESINHELERYKRANEEKRVTTCASAALACGDSALFGLGLGGAASGAVAASVITLQMGIVSAGIVAIPVSLGALFGIWAYVTLKPTLKVCLGMERDS
uniref:GB1/RHD3-type G domain-containing protein n=1 Tax=Ditylenchus dipsaci TaxID=166011 RepID=A0A915D6N7_9BILA